MAEFQALIIYGDGMQAIYYEEKNVTLNRDGEKVIPLLVAPSIELTARYDLDDDDLKILTEDGKKAMWVEYPVNEVDWLSKSKQGAVLFIWCAFDTSKTSIMAKKERLFDMMKEYDRESKLLKARVYSLQKELEYVTNSQIELAIARRQFTDIVAKKDVSISESSDEGGD